MRSLYDRAIQVHKKGKPLDAIDAYQKVIEAKLPDPHGYKGQSQKKHRLYSQTDELKNGGFAA